MAQLSELLIGMSIGKSENERTEIEQKLSEAYEVQEYWSYSSSFKEAADPDDDEEHDELRYVIPQNPRRIRYGCCLSKFRCFAQRSILATKFYGSLCSLRSQPLTPTRSRKAKSWHSA